MSIFKRLFGKRPAHPDPEKLLETILAFIQATTWPEKQRIVEAHPELLSDEADALLGQLIEADPALAAEVASLVQQATAGGNIANASGDRSVAIGGNVSGSSTIITGDRNQVQQGKYNIHIERASGLAIGDDASVKSDNAD